MIIITSKIEGFRRAGVAHSTTPTPYAEDRFTPDQLAQLQAEPNLFVQLLPKSEAIPAPGSMVDPDAAPETVSAETTTLTPAPSEQTDTSVSPEASAGAITTLPVDPAPVTAPKAEAKAAQKGKGK
ncbi:HI1506-related protein [Stenotrophomonas sp. B1-1]|uniref:HI1506-related protein n=1 Tax=Stenotrophomonas sp. B1-1 TaxID=2710648 RepID=UPI0013DAF05E|nr:HI1506-related protein [Stenotrophomonas sp. B1-1]